MNTYSKKMLARFISCAFIFHSAPIALATSEEVKENTEINKSIDLEQSDPQITTAETSNDKKGDENAVESNQQTFLVSKQETLDNVIHVVDEVINDANNIPKRIYDCLDGVLLRINCNSGKLDKPVIINGDFSSNFVKSFFENSNNSQAKPYECLSIDISDADFSTEKLKTILENNPPKIVMLSNFYCKDFEHFKGLFNLLKNSKKISFIYVETCVSCNKEDSDNCKNCKEVDVFCEEQLKNGVWSKKFFDYCLSNYYKDLISDLINKLKQLYNNKQSSLEIDITDDEIAVIVDCFIFNRFLRNSERIVDLMVNAINRKSKLTLLDFIYTEICECNGDIPVSDLPFNDKEFFSTCVHEAGHAVVFYLSGFAPIAWISASTNCSGITCRMWDAYRSYDHLLACIRCSMAGQIAQELFGGLGLSLGGESDYKRVMRNIERAILLSDRSLALESKKDEKAKKMSELYDKLYKETREIVLENEELIKRIAKCLMSKRICDGVAFMGGPEFARNVKEIKKDLQTELKERANAILSNPENLTEGLVKCMEEYVKKIDENKKKLIGNIQSSNK